MPRLYDILRPRVFCDCGQYRLRTILRRNSGSHTLGCFDGQGEIGRVQGRITLDHQRQRQLLTATTRQSQTDQPTTMAGHEIDIFGTRVTGGHHQITFILTVLVIHQDDHAAGANILDYFFSCVK